MKKQIGSRREWGRRFRWQLAAPGVVVLVLLACGTDDARSSAGHGLPEERVASLVGSAGAGNGASADAAPAINGGAGRITPSESRGVDALPLICNVIPKSDKCPFPNYPAYPHYTICNRRIGAADSYADCISTHSYRALNAGVSYCCQ
jgi:hypothetical protein